MQAFKDGKYNAIVATSIGEEGLDIGEVDIIVCYDAQKDPLRMVRYDVCTLIVLTLSTASAYWPDWEKTRWPC
jgi:excinuclease UvrABC helicase subunit UvrB